ncbi:MAG: glycosyltransferase, partial [Pseudaminobacter sp.]|nr:glycosyltransferase [Pseudaminobacter sp.]
MQRFYYDLSELYLLTRGRLKFYGIARVVAEIAFEIHRIRPDVIFVVYDESRRGFFRVHPRFGKSSYNGVVDLELPKSIIPFRVRGPKPGRSLQGRVVASCAGFCVRILNRLKSSAFDRYLKPIDLNDGHLFSAGRPKLLTDFIDHLERTGSATRLHVLLHDCIPLHDFDPRPDTFQLNFRADNIRIIGNASLVIANSSFTQRELVAMAGRGLLPPLPAHSVVPLAHECRDDGEMPTIGVPGREYVIGVGITLGRKNLEVVLEALEHLIAQGRTPPLMVIAGANRRRTKASLRKGRYAALAPHVLMVDNPSQANLIRLYQNALATVMPSRLEGWGLPLGESLWLGTPALAAPLSSLPEVGGDLAVYFDPDSPAELAALLHRLSTDHPYRYA